MITPLHLKSDAAHMFAARYLLLSLRPDLNSTLNFLEYSLQNFSFISLSITLSNSSTPKYLHAFLGTFLITSPFFLIQLSVNFPFLITTTSHLSTLNIIPMFPTKRLTAFTNIHYFIKFSRTSNFCTVLLGEILVAQN